MELRVLRYFLTVAREETLNRAADVLHITQPTLGRQLSQLEDELGVALFERQGRRVVLTADGLLLRRRAEEILELVDKAEQELTHSEDTVAGTVALGYGEISAMHRLAECAADFSRRYPLVRFSLFSGTADVVKERMDHGLIDVGLLMEPIAVEKYNFVRTDVVERQVAFMRPDDPLAGQEAIRPEQLSGKPLILPYRYQNLMRNWMGPYFHEENVRFVENLPTMGAVLAAMGQGYMLTIQGAMPFRDPSKLAVVPLSGSQELHSILAWKRGQPFSPAAELFIKHIQCLSGKDQLA